MEVEREEMSPILFMRIYAHAFNTKCDEYLETCVGVGRYVPSLL